MNINAGTNVSGAFGLAVAKKINQATEEQGKQAVELIQSATGSDTSQGVKQASGVGTRLDVRA